MAEFFEMGGHAAYIWPSYAAFAFVLGGLVIWTWRRNARQRAALAEAERLAGRASTSPDNTGAASHGA